VKSVSDLSIEERLAAGASVDDLVAAGVLYDDYDPDNDPDYFFAPLPTEDEIAKDRAEASKCTPMSEEEFEYEIAIGEWYNSGRYLREDPSNKPVRPSEK
jgi:hypothetical protein